MTEISKSFRCEFCNKLFSTKGNCLRHHQTCKNKDIQDIIKKTEERLKYEQELKIKDEQIKFLQSMLDKYADKPAVINYNNSNNNTMNNNFTIKQMVSKLEPINFQDVKEYMNEYSNSYKDKGTKGFAQFLCDYPFKDKFFTSDFSRNTIVYKTNEQKFIRDPESSYLINRSIKENSSDIIQKAIDRLNFLNTQIKNSSEDDTEEYIIKKSKIKKLISIAEDISSSEFIDKDMSNVFRNSGLKIYQSMAKENILRTDEMIEE